MALVQIPPSELAAKQGEGHEIITEVVVVYDDGRSVQVPDRKYFDVIKCERHFNKPFSEVSGKEEAVAWLAWHRLKRHDDANEHPKVPFENWLDTIERFSVGFYYDDEREPDGFLAAGQPS